MQTLNLIGAGRVAKPLAKLWHQRGELTINQVLARTIDSAQAAVDFIGAGMVCRTLSEMQPADYVFLALPDDAILPVCEQIKDTVLARSDTVFFHASGAINFDCLSPFSERVASIHPVFSFADSEYVIKNFSGAYCVLRGSETGKQCVAPIFRSIGANVLMLDNLDGPMYHAGLVFVSNYLLPLLAASTDCLRAAGIPEATSKAMVLPLINSVLAQANSSDTWAQALTGPINRGDITTISHHMQSLTRALPQLLALYRELGLQTVNLATQQGLATSISIKLDQLLRGMNENDSNGQ